MEPGPPRRRRARPVADAPVDALLLRAEDLTKGWLLALLEQAPLEDAPHILAADLARDGPRVCAAVVRALADDTDLRRIEPGGALEMLVAQAGEITGAGSVEATSRAIEALGAVVWSALRSELTNPDADQISELSERLSLVLELVRVAALRRNAGETPTMPDATAVRGPAGSNAPSGSGPSSGPVLLRRATDREVGPTEGVAEAGPARPMSGPTPAPEPDAAPSAPAGSSSGPAGASSGSAAGAAADPLWKGAVEDEISRSGRTGSPLSLLLVELEDAERVLAVETGIEATATFGRFAQAVRTVVRRQDILACETECRAWIIARDTGRMGAQALGSRLVSAVSEAQPWRGAPMMVNIGVAVLGDDGQDANSLINAADEAKFAAAASGVGVFQGGPLEGEDPPPAEDPGLAG